MTLLAQPLGIPAPRPTPPMQPYWDGCRLGELRILRCTDCDYRTTKAAPVCARCHRSSFAWAATAGRGTLYSWTVVWRPQHPSFTVPYAPAVVALDEGVHVLSSVIGCEVEDLHPEMAVAVEFHPASDDIWLPYFRPVIAG